MAFCIDFFIILYSFCKEKFLDTAFRLESTDRVILPTLIFWRKFQLFDLDPFWLEKILVEKILAEKILAFIFPLQKTLIQ
jgi:hypothetical protein